VTSFGKKVDVLVPHWVATDNILHNKQFEQIKFTYNAITGALERRGLADKVELEVQVQPRFVLKKKSGD